MESFLRLGLAEPLAQALASFGFEAPTSVQAETIPVLLSRRDAIVESETGTGKTFAYLGPAFQLISVLERKGQGEPGAIIAAPTQELAVQIGREAERLAKAASLPAKTVVLLGGTPIEKQAIKLKSKPEIVVGTLGRLADLVSLGKLRTSSLKILVLDEADRLFASETENLARALLASAPISCTKVLVSATIPERLRREMRPLLREAVEVSPIGVAVLSGSIEHWCFYCDGRKRLDFTRRFEAAVKPERCLVFLTMASRVEKAALALAHLGLPIEAIHAGMDKETRRVALDRFSRGEVRYLLTSDLGARGLDIPGITHILSLDLPEEPTIYTHRAGRTGRAGAKGISIILADGIELGRASKIATKGGFVFRCKLLEEGMVLEPTSEEFFARVESAEEDRMAAKASRVGDNANRIARPGRNEEQRDTHREPHKWPGARRQEAESERNVPPRGRDAERSPKKAVPVLRKAPQPEPAHEAREGAFDNRAKARPEARDRPVHGGGEGYRSEQARPGKRRDERKPGARPITDREAGRSAGGPWQARRFDRPRAPRANDEGKTRSKWPGGGASRGNAGKRAPKRPPRA
jgi:superfamily II DNA/RNA helicase